MQATIRKNQFNVNLAAGELLQYRLRVIQGAGAIYAWSDDAGNNILPLPGAPAPDDITWQLRSAAAEGGVRLTVPQNGGYSRSENSPRLLVYDLVLLFATAIKYTLTIDHCGQGGNVIENLVDIDFTRDAGNDADRAEHMENVTI